ncbi:MAG TPA: GNAT family N-acetyltransferase [Symbiobacteriaceae bacterium]
MEPCRTYENHWLACMAAVGRGRVTRLEGGIVLTTSRMPGAFLNFGLPRDCHADRLPFFLEASGALLAANGHPPALFLSPDAGDVPALSAVLLDRGWHPAVHQVVLERDLPVTGVDPAPGVAVDPVGPAELGHWIRTLAAAYGAAPDRALRISRAWASLWANPGEGCRSLLCLARVDGQPVGTGLVWMQGALASLYCGAVLPEYQRRGVERTTILYRLRWAAEQGCHRAILQTEVGSPVERLCVDKLGFRPVYHRTLWVPAGSWRIRACG